MEEVELPNPGPEELLSSTQPSFPGGTYTIQLDQPISAYRRDQDLKQEATKTAYLASQFNLPADSIHSIHPKQNQAATHDTLPHIVFNDSTLPWQRIGSHQAENPDHPPGDDAGIGNRVPWMALLVFSPDELCLDDAEKEGIFAKTSLKDRPKELESMAFRIPLGELGKLNEGTAQVPLGDFDINQASNSDTNVIFPKASLLNHLFAAYDDDGNRLPGGPDISRHRFLAHVRRMDTTSTENSDSNEVKPTREFSVVIANRIGPLDVDSTSGSQAIVHLVSLENIESVKPFPLPETIPDLLPSGQSARVGLISLYSWSYTCLPPSALNVKQAFDNIARTASVLKPIIQPQREPQDDVAKRVLSRLEDGYTITRSVMRTGEVAVSLFRGPLTPYPVGPMKWDLCSNSGSDLSIFDKELGMMDITYSSAWLLGHTLALADQHFTTSLTRVRHQILHQETTTGRQRMPQVSQRQRYKREDLVRSLGSLIDESHQVHPASVSPSDLSDASIVSFIESAMKKAAFELAKKLASETGDDRWETIWDDQTPTTSYDEQDEQNEPASPDWTTILRFVLDLYHLVNIPPKYLLPDQSMVPRESLRLFFIDRNWIDAAVDGALSLGNHETDNDVVRKAIKEGINRLFTDPQYHPPCLPRSGFVLRSTVVAQVVGLKVSVEVDDKGAAAGGSLINMVRQVMIEKETMLGLFDDVLPRKEGMDGLKLRFELPPHQQYFSLGTVTDKGLEMVYKRQYTCYGTEDADSDQPVATIKWPRNGKGKAQEADGLPDTDRSPVFVWGSAEGLSDVWLVLVEKLAGDVHATLVEKMERKWYDEVAATSAMLACQLNCSSWEREIGVRE